MNPVAEFRGMVEISNASRGELDPGYDASIQANKAVFRDGRNETCAVESYSSSKVTDDTRKTETTSCIFGSKDLTPPLQVV